MLFKKIFFYIKMSEWNKTQEKFLQQLGEKAKAWDWLHQNSSLRLSWWNKWLSIFNVIFSAITSGLNATDLWGNPVLFNFIVLFASIITFALAGVVKNLNYSERIEDHRQAGNKFKIYANDVQIQLGLRRKDRGNAKDSVEAFTKKFNNLINDCPNIEEKIIIKFKDKFATSDFSKPELADEIKGIDIKEDSSNSDNVTIEIDSSLQNDLENALENI